MAKQNEKKGSDTAKQEGTKNPPVIVEAETNDEITKATEKKTSEDSGEVTVKAAPEKMRKIRGLDKHKCRVADSVYQFNKNEELVVPEHVARILCGANKAIQL